MLCWKVTTQYHAEYAEVLTERSHQFRFSLRERTLALEFHCFRFTGIAQDRFFIFHFPILPSSAKVLSPSYAETRVSLNTPAPGYGYCDNFVAIFGLSTPVASLTLARNLHTNSSLS